MKLRQSYNKLVIKVETYLTERRNAGKWERHLPERIFDPHLWLWEKRSLRVGAAWGACMALAPLPLQSFFAALCCIWSRGNVPVGILACWISVPGYQIIAWPLQWVLGAWVCVLLLGMDSGASIDLVAQTAKAAPEGLDAMLHLLGGINIELFCAEFVIGCILSCALIWLFFYILVGLIVSRSVDEDID